MSHHRVGGQLLLSVINLRSSYRTDVDDFAQDLFRPALGAARQYDRATGFFSSACFGVLAEPFSDFFVSGGRMTLITSPLLSAADLDAIERVYVGRDVSGIPSNPMAALRSGKLPAPLAFGHLLYTGQLQAYIAKPQSTYEQAIYHEKFGLLSDERGNTIGFSGSLNDSELALKANFERLETFSSWASQDARRKVAVFREQFRRLVDNETSRLEVQPLISAYGKGWLRQRPMDERTQPMAKPMISTRSTSIEALVPSPRRLFEHQEQAISDWARAEGRGIFAIATGGGKTITALSLASRLFDSLGGRPMCIVVVAPFIHLVDQWREVAKEFGLDPIRCAVSEKNWRAELATAVHALNSGHRKVLSIAVTAATLQRPAFQEILGRVRVHMLVIGDEVHNYGAPRIQAALPKQATFRVGLSATPERWLDEEGTKAIHAYFGIVVSTYTLANAIRDGILTPYDYFPIIVELEPEEAAEYAELSAALARYSVTGEEGSLSTPAKMLLLKRARLLGSARGKLPQLRRLLERRRQGTHILIYCGDGRSDVGEMGLTEGGENDEDESMRQVDAVVKMIAEDLGMSCARYTSETAPEDRTEILRHFDSGLIQVLVAIRCLDEGVDVPSTRTAFILASSTNPRQFIQRRGRVLRRSPKTGKEFAEIYDFFVVPPAPGVDDSLSIATTRKLFSTQLRRVVEFSTSARNGGVARAPLLRLTERLKIVEVWDDGGDGEEGRAPAGAQ